MARSRWVGGVIAIAGAAALVVGGAARAQDGDVDQQLVDDIVALVPDDTEGISDEDAGAVIDQMFAIASSVAPSSGDDSSALTGPCGGFAFSFDGDGELIDAAFDLGDDQPPQDLLGGGQAFTDGNPFTVDTDGRVEYLGFAPQSGPGPMDHTWNLSVGSVDVASGGDPNSNAKNRNAGVIDMDEELPFPLTFKTPAAGEMTAPDFPGCDGKGVVEINGNGLLDPAGIVGMALTAIGLMGLFVARPARTWRAG
jgi:hypothetical protein